MTKAEQARLRRLELENAELRARLDRSMEIYRDQAIELIDLRATIDLLRELLPAK